MKLSVIILNYNVQHFLQICLESVEAALTTIDSEIIVVDNNSPDGSCKMIKEYFSHVVLIENQENSGFAKGNNIGVAKAKGDYICVLNPDTVVAEDTFIKLLNFVENQKNIGIIGCRLIDGKGYFLPESKRNIPIVRVAFQKMMGNPKHYYANHLKEDETGKADILVGAFMLLKKQVYNQVKGFDEDYFMYGEDVDISYKVLKMGYKNYYYGQTTVVHYKGESTLKDEAYAKRFYGAMQIFYKKHFNKNVIFDALVWLGINVAYIIRKQPKTNTVQPKEYVFISDNMDKDLQNKLKNKMVLQSELDAVTSGSEIIFNTKYVTYKQVIKYMSTPKIQSKATFKILSKSGRFILGSNDSKHRGDVISF